MKRTPGNKKPGKKWHFYTPKLYLNTLNKTICKQLFLQKIRNLVIIKFIIGNKNILLFSEHRSGFRFRMAGMLLFTRGCFRCGKQ
ncbi:Uncharacterized protein dnm_075380 [Desulfonema magnum]|uniref:Uncharacterized protein n=1 Tax=Desulfonema magnum TaxID=45655 RepID=A0A975GRZ2_9BACT|nr:Uncharacterized protein dnm_075380 [Desulfonema magnum]